MKINKNIRIKVIKRMIKRYKRLDESLSPYDHDSLRYYYLIDYWEDKLKEIS